MKNNKISIYINGEKKLVNTNKSLFEILEDYSIKHKSIAVEINKEIIAKSNYKSTLINSGDKIEIVHFIGGG